MQSPEASPSLPVGFQRPEANPRMQSSKDDLGSIHGKGGEGEHREIAKEVFLFLKSSFPLGEGGSTHGQKTGSVRRHSTRYVYFTLCFHVLSLLYP